MTSEDETQARQIAAQALGFDLLGTDNSIEVYGRDDLPSTLERDHRSGEWTLFERNANYEQIGDPLYAGDADLDVSDALKELQDVDPQHQHGHSMGM